MWMWGCGDVEGEQIGGERKEKESFTFAGTRGAVHAEEVAKVRMETEAVHVHLGQCQVDLEL